MQQSLEAGPAGAPGQLVILIVSGTGVEPATILNLIMEDLIAKDLIIAWMFALVECAEVCSFISKAVTGYGSFVIRYKVY